MAKLTLNTIGSRYGSVEALNDNFDAIEQALENTFSLDGTSPNALEADLDMNGNDILNASSVQTSSLVINGIPVSPGSVVNSTPFASFFYIATSGQTTFSVAPYVPSVPTVKVKVNGLEYPSYSLATSFSSVVIPAAQAGDEVVIDVFVSEVEAVATLSVYEFTATAGQTTFVTGATALASNNVQVEIDGLSIPPSGFTVSGSSIILPALLTGQEVVVRAFINKVEAGVDASQIAFSRPGGVPTNVNAKLSETVSAKDFGAKGDGVADDTAAIQAFFNAVTSNGYAGVLPPGTYKITSPLTINVTTNNFSITGPAASAAIFSVQPSFAGGTIAIQLVGAGSPVGWKIGGFSVQGSLGATGTAVVGFQFGSATTAAINVLGYQFSTVEHVHITGFATNWKVVHARMIEFRNCSAWNTSVSATNQTSLEITQNGAFTGDLRFYNCQYVNKNLSGNKNVSIASTVGPYSNVTGYGNVAGIKFIACDFYSGEKGMYIYASSSAWVSDVWVVSGCQFDQVTTNAIWVESFNSGSNIENIHFSDSYVNQSTSSQVTLTSTGTGGSIKSVWLSQCTLLQGLSTSVNVSGAACSGIHILSNEIVDCAGVAAIQLSSPTDIKVRGNRHRTGLLAAQPTYIIQVSAGTTKINITENSGEATSAVINDLSGATPIKVINNNGGYNPRPQASITTSPAPATFNYTNNSGAPQIVSIGGGTVSAISVDGLSITPTTNLFVPVPAGKVLAITYSVAPTLFSLGY